jgi:hypothetical protein
MSLIVRHLKIMLVTYFWIKYFKINFQFSSMCNGMNSVATKSVVPYGTGTCNAVGMTDLVAQDFNPALFI